MQGIVCKVRSVVRARHYLSQAQWNNRLPCGRIELDKSTVLV